MSYCERKYCGTVAYNTLAIPNIEEIHGEQLQEISVLYLIALNILHKQASQVENNCLITSLRL